MHDDPPRLPLTWVELTWIDHSGILEEIEHPAASKQELLRDKSLNEIHEKLIDNVEKAQARQTADYAKRRSTQTSLRT
jgi:hypothetical protein